MKYSTRFFAFLFITGIFLSCKKNNDTPAEPTPVLTTVTTATGIVGGPKNTVITIKGTNFITDLSKITVTVNGKICEILSATADSIKAKILPYCGTGNIVLNLNGTVLNGPIFTYVYTYTLTSITNGVAGYQDGPMASSKWEDISGLCVDSSNNVYTSSYSKPAVRKITSDYLNVSTLAGDRTVGDVNGQGTNAKLGNADNISVDYNGTIFYADQYSSKVKKIDKLGNVTTFISNPIAAPVTAQVGKLSNVYVLSGDEIAKYNSAGVLQWKFKSKGVGSVDGDTSVVKFNNITFGNVTIDDNEQNLYFATFNFSVSGYPSQIKKLNLQTLTTTTIAGVENVSGSVDGNAASATFKLVTGLALDKQGGVFIADGFGNKIRYLKNGVVSTIIGASGSGDVDGDISIAKISYPDGLGMNNKGDLIIACVSNNKIKRLIID
jgi:hypothetical protein